MIFLILGTVLGAVCVFILIILSVVCYKKSRQTTEQVNREDNSSEIACHDDDRTRHFSSAAEPKTDHSSAYRLDDQKDKASGRVPSAPHRLRQSQHVAPPAYEDALNDPVMIWATFGLLNSNFNKEIHNCLFFGRPCKLRQISFIEMRTYFSLA